MQTDPLQIIDNKIQELINDKYEYTFEELKINVEKILKSVDTFLVEEELNTKAFDFYLKNVITKRNEIKKQEEKSKIDDSKQTKYMLIESICKKIEFNSQEELIKKIEELEKKSNFELNEINKA